MISRSPERGRVTFVSLQSERPFAVSLADKGQVPLRDRLPLRRD